MGPERAQEASVSELCSYCGARIRMAEKAQNTARELALQVVCVCLVLATIIPIFGFTEHWFEQQGQRVFSRMIWREPVESWNQ
jgi:hypothetical protein